MKRALVFTLILVIVSAGVITYTTASLKSGLKDVNFVRTDYIGDISAMDGVSLMLRSSLQRRQFWNIRADFTSGDVSYDVQTEFSQNKSEGERDDEPSGVTLYPDAYILGTNSFVNPETEKLYDDLSEFEKMVYDYIMECPDTGSFRKRIRLSDYEGYYSFNICLDVDAETHGTMMLNSFGGNFYNYNEQETEAKAFDAMKSFFRIPFAEDHYTTIHIEKDNGNLVMASIYEEGDDGENAYNGYSSSVIGNNMCYFTISNRTNSGTLLDTSLIPGGYGIYALPFEIEENTRWADYKFDELNTLIPLNEEIRVENLAISQDKSKLFVQYLLDDKLMVSTYDSASGKLLNDIEVAELSDDDWFYFYVGEGFYAVFNNSEITLLTENEDGVLNLEFKAAQSTDFKYFPPFADMRGTKMEYDGSRLVIAGFTQIYQDENGEPLAANDYCNSYFVCAAGKDGIRYFGTFESGLDKASLRGDGLNIEDDYYAFHNSNRDFRFNVGTWNDNAMTIKFIKN